MIGGLGRFSISSAVVRAPSTNSGRGRLAPNANLVGGKTFTAQTLAKLLASSGNKTVSLMPGQKFTIKNGSTQLANRITGRNTNSVLKVISSRDLNAAVLEISLKPGVKSGKDAIKLQTYELGTATTLGKLKGSVSFTVSVLPRTAL